MGLTPQSRIHAPFVADPGDRVVLPITHEQFKNVCEK